LSYFGRVVTVFPLAGTLARWAKARGWAWAG
jgi:hypothetical protein